MRIVHLTASTFFGGPERQMLGLAAALPTGDATHFLSFAEGGRCAAFLQAAARAGFVAEALTHDTPHFRAAVRELAGRLRTGRADLLLCHGYKANLLGRPAARRAGLPVVAVARGWTGADRKLRVYEALDRWHLRWMDRVVCVSAGQARKVRRAGVCRRRTVVIRNAARLDDLREATPTARAELLAHFAEPGAAVVVAAGRLSPEKGFAILVEAARRVLVRDSGARFLLFGEGELRTDLHRRIDAAGLAGRFVLAGFRPDLDRLLPAADLVVLPSYTEGLPNVLLEASAAGVAVVATAVGGTPEVVADGRTGFLVAPGDADALAGRIAALLADGDLRRAMGRAGRERMHGLFTFAAQARAYRRLFAELVPRARRAVA